MFRFLRLSSILLILALALPSALFAQSSGSSMSGRVLDQTGAALPGVSITATNVATGFNRTTVSGPDGGYLFASLPIGTYTVAADLSGFASVTTKDVELNVATGRTLNVTLKQSAIKEQITVTAEAPLIESTPSIGTVVSQKELENLPLNGRQFANLASLAPGTSLAVNSDPTKPGQLVVALNGGTGRNVNYMIDGGDNTDDTIGGALQNFNLEAVQEFKIQTMQYKAEYGRSSGGVLTVVTKTGTNDLSGSAYGFFRDKGLNEKTYAERQADAPKSDYQRKQYGASIGGPIVKDRAHFFATYEKLDRKTNYLVDTGGIYPALDGQTVATPFKDDLATVKGSVNLTPAQFLQVRYGYQKNSDIYGASITPPPSALGTTTNKYSSILVGHSWTIGLSKVNDFVFQYTKFKNAITANSNDPNLNFPNGSFVGQNPNTPQTTNQTKYQYKDDFSWSNQHHDFKAGVAFINEPTLSGDFSTGLTGQYSLARNDPNSPVTDITIFGGFSGYNTPIKEYSVYLQDDWAVTQRLTINAGARYDLWTGFDLNQSNNPIWQMLKTQRKYKEAYLQDFWGASDSLSNDTNNYSPRLGFSYDLNGDGRRIFRGGIGRFYDFPYTNATILFPGMAVQGAGYGQIYGYHDGNGIKNADGTFFHPGQPLPPNKLPTAGGTTPAEVASPTVTKVPFSDQISMGYSWQVSNTLGLNFEAVGIWYKDIPFRFRANPTLDANGAPMADRRFNELGVGGNFRMWEGGGKANYKGFNIGIHSRIANNLELQGFYTFSKTNGNILPGADEFRLTGTDFQRDAHSLGRDASQDPLNPWCSYCFGPLYSDATHRVTLSTVYQAPMGVNLSGILRWHSGTPYTIINAAGADLNGDSYRIDLAPGVSHVNSARGASFNQLDARASKDFRFMGNAGVELIAEMFNVLNSKNPRNFDRLGVAHVYAGDPGQGEQRLIQLGARVHF
jgi:Carboxypeptidase regulatory-like domain/TonB dependent receptor/TonB-dependent Receptor Plug Domain